jgi:predicted GIY-YIG superfamily endonuclease
VVDDTSTVYQEYDLNEYAGHPCVYVISLAPHIGLYKFGVTGDIIDRLASHRATFARRGGMRLVKLWKCASGAIMRSTEKKIKNFAKQNEILTAEQGQHELFRTTNVVPVLERVTSYVDTDNAHDATVLQVEAKRLENEGKKLDNEGKRLDIQLLMLQLGMPCVDSACSQPPAHVTHVAEPVKMAKPVSRTARGTAMRFACVRCRMRFATDAEMGQHGSSCTVVGPNMSEPPCCNECPHCRKMFSRSNNVPAHVARCKAAVVTM